MSLTIQLGLYSLQNNLTWYDFFSPLKDISYSKIIQCPSYLMFESFLQDFPIKIKSNLLQFGANSFSISRVPLWGIYCPNTLTPLAIKHNCTPLELKRYSYPNVAEVFSSDKNFLFNHIVHSHELLNEARKINPYQFLLQQASFQCREICKFSSEGETKLAQMLPAWSFATPST